MKRAFLLLFVLYNSISYSQNRYDQPATIPNNQQYYQLNTEPIKQAIEYRQQRHNEIKDKLENLEQRAYDLKVIADDSLNAEMDAVIELIQKAYDTDLSQSDGYKTYSFASRFINESYYRFTKRKQD